ncbi:hypothetical protein [Streptomyces sp. NPDC047000]|uniref:hypothetical protein n=1 Tax=Streptomyces sp. NPDC047000 TaxID=3155474 RepID=UPI0034108203
MHRTTTTAALLVTMAVSALSGCTTVQRPAAPGPPTAPSRPSAQRPDGSARPRVVQAPAREALETTGPSRRPGPGEREPAGGPAPVRRPPDRPARPAPRPRPAPPRAGVPAVPDASGLSRAVRRGTDVCALGRTYGGWRPDSPEARVCAQAYRR